MDGIELALPRLESELEAEREAQRRIRVARPSPASASRRSGVGTDEHRLELAEARKFSDAGNHCL
jgi:hypothetical protein